MKIEGNNEYPFFYKYHKQSYIKSHDCRPIVTVSEKQRKYILENDIKKELVVYHIDGELIDNQSIDKCDYGIYTEENHLILVELKGSDYNHACKQLASTINYIKDEDISISQFFARIVLSKGRTPATLTSEEAKLKKLLKNEKLLKSSSLQMKEKLSDLNCKI
ncbi:MAG: hypothetical protein MJZ34_14285 [Paludibacteraceae bacterium]|nr:hypothetical protein [Paludibacteraceae bacterium]